MFVLKIIKLIFFSIFFNGLDILILKIKKKTEKNYF
jgi:hypothetical protein